MFLFGIASNELFGSNEVECNLCSKVQLKNFSFDTDGGELAFGRAGESPLFVKSLSKSI